MPDAIQPVAAQIQPPNPNQGIQALSGILGLQQQGQQLQLGQQQIAAGAANLQQTEQKNRELSGLASLSRAAMDPKSKYWDGNNFDADAYRRDATAVAPVYGGPAIDQHITAIKNVVETRRAFNTLGKETNATLSDMLRGFQSGPMTDDAVSNFAENARSTIGNNPDARERLGMLVGQLNGTKDPRARQQLAANASAMLGGFALQKPSQVEAGGYIQPGTTTEIGPNAGAFTPAGGKIAKTLAPQVVNPPGGVPTVMGGAAGGGGGGSRNLSGFPGPQPTDQDMKNFADYSGNLSSRVAVAADTVPRLNLVEAAADNIRTGGGSQIRENLAKRAQGMGLGRDVVDAIAGGNLAKTQEAEKMLFQTTMSGLRQAMQGDPARVAEFQAAERVFPSIDTDPRARQQILGFIRDQSQRDFSEQQALNDARKNGTFNPVTWQAEYQQKLRAGQVPGVPASQIPGAQAPSKQMPTGAKLQAYADKYTHGDLARAQAALKEHGYK